MEVNLLNIVENIVAKGEVAQYASARGKGFACKPSTPIIEKIKSFVSVFHKVITGLDNYPCNYK